MAPVQNLQGSLPKSLQEQSSVSGEPQKSGLLGTEDLSPASFPRAGVCLFTLTGVCCFPLRELLLVTQRNL